MSGWLARLLNADGGGLGRRPSASDSDSVVRHIGSDSASVSDPGRREGRGRGKGFARGERGIALVMVLAMVVFLTAFIVEFTYQSRVEYLQGAHYRDKVRAHYLAKSGVRIYTLFMAFAQQAASNPLISQYAGMYGIDIGDKLWQQLPFIDTAFLRVAMSGMGLSNVDDFDLAALEQGRVEFDVDTEMEAQIDRAIERESTALTRSFLDFEGDFRAEINDEDGKININTLADSTKQDIRTDPIALAMYGLMAHERYDDLFDDRSEFDRWEIVANIKDYVDPDEQQSTLLGGFEDSLYDDSDLWDRPAAPKNFKFDAMDEVQLVPGINDEIYQTFGPQWTIYGNNKINITSCSDAVLYALIRAFADPTSSDALIREAVGEIQVMRMLNMLTTETFISTVTAKGITLTDQGGLQNLIKTNSRHFTIVSTGYVGDVESTLEVVMNFQGSKFKTLSWKEY